MEKYNLIALDIIDGLDGKFYVVDINGIIGVNSIMKYKAQFDKRILEIFGEKVNIECSTFVKNGDELITKTDSNVVIKNLGFKYENKMDWRRVYNFPCPQINEKINPHSHPDYPKYLLKPEFSFKGRGIILSNDKIIKKGNNFIEEFIPSKLIDGHCYSIRVIMVINKKESYPLLFLNRICQKPIIKNLHEGKLNEEESLSYISNLKADKENEIAHYVENKDPKLIEFIKKIKIYDI